MKLVCTIGTQGFADGSRFYRGDVYEVDDDTASTLIAHRYATAYVEPEEEPVVPSDPESEELEQVEAGAIPEETDVQPPIKDKPVKGRKKNKR